MIFSLSLFAQNAEPKLHGYIQSRFSSDFENTNDFMIRRAKLWVDGNVPNIDNVTYKVQMVYRSFKDESLMLQDAFADVKINDSGFLRVGRFVPNFMLQRMQPDYEISDIERAGVISGFIHSSKSMARQIGVQFTYQTENSPLNFSFGIFNANLESSRKNNDMNLLYTSHTQFSLVEKEDYFFQVGFSLAYRYANALSMSNIFAENELLTGNDLRYGFEYQFEFNKFGMQAEFLKAKIAGHKPWGYYIGSDFTISEHFQATAGIEKFSDINNLTNDNEWYSVGLIYYFSERNKLMTDFKTQFNVDSNINIAEIQYQIFFN